MRAPFLALALLTLAGGAAQAQIATPGGFARSGVAGPMTANGGFGDRRNAGGGIPYVRPNTYGGGGLVRRVPPPRNYGYGGYGAYAGYAGGGYGYGRPRSYVYDRPWARYPYNGSGYRSGPRVGLGGYYGY